MPPESDSNPLRRLLARLEIDDHELLHQAVRHSSYVRERGEPAYTANERLEFLGDAVLDLVIAEYLYRTYPHKTEGQLTKIKSAIVSERALVQIARKFAVGDLLYLGKGEEETGCRNKPSIVSAALEALIGAVFILHGLPKAREFVLALTNDAIAEAVEEGIRGDFKSTLQELTQQRTKVAPTYRVLSETGPPHDRTFIVEVSLNGRRIGVGQGKSKQVAEQQAAASALQRADDWDREPD